MYRRADPLALDPLGPIGLGPIVRVYPLPDPLALDPLSPIQTGETHDRADRGSHHGLERLTPRDRARTGAKVTT